METNDPDDYLSLLFLLGNPNINLKAVTITPGAVYQVALVERTLALFGKKDIPVGAYNISHPKSCVSPWHEQAFGKIILPENINENTPTGAKVLQENCDENTILITGAPLKNLGLALDMPDFRLGTLVAQGGFAGEGVVPFEKQLEKFKGKKTCPTFNLNGDIPSAFKALASEKIQKRYFVSKNVCHDVFYGYIMHQLVKEKIELLELENTENKMEETENSHLFSLKMIHKGMNFYLQNKHRKPEIITETTKNETLKKDIFGKNLHDPLACCCALDLTIGEWAEVEIFREKGEWGSKLAQNTNTWIITDYNHELFVKTFLGNE